MIRRVKAAKRAMIEKYARPSDTTGAMQTVIAIAALCALWICAVLADRRSHWWLLVSVPLLSLFLLRIFALMHECGHGCLFRRRSLNQAVGFLFGVVCGMPQYVWARHHNHHHSTNGNWEKYRGAVATISVREFAALSRDRQRRYQWARHPALAPLGGFIYLVFNPRFTWIKGTLALWTEVLKHKWHEPGRPLRSICAGFQTRYWTSRREYWHMCGNNVALLAGVVFLCASIGPGTFLPIYLLSTSLAGGGGLVLFTVQHNFRHAYATDTARWDYDVGALRGTSFLVLPGWLNWFTANIGYHHVHHLSASIPNYHLVQCHDEYAALFVEVPRISLGGVRRALDYILWDERAERIISIAEYRAAIPVVP